MKYTYNEMYCSDQLTIEQMLGYAHVWVSIYKSAPAASGAKRALANAKDWFNKAKAHGNEAHMEYIVDMIDSK